MSRHTIHHLTNKYLAIPIPPTVLKVIAFPGHSFFLSRRAYL